MIALPWPYRTCFARLAQSLLYEPGLARTLWDGRVHGAPNAYPEGRPVDGEHRPPGDGGVHGDSRDGNCGSGSGSGSGRAVAVGMLVLTVLTVVMAAAAAWRLLS